MPSVDAERVIKAGGVYINHRRVTEADYVLIPGEHILPNNVTLVRVGKCIRGFAKTKQLNKIRDYYESGWVVQVLLGFFSFLENRPKIALNQYTMCILSVYTLLKVVGY